MSGTIQYAGGETRETVHCYGCPTKKRPLKWYEFWKAWLCPKCMEARVEASCRQLESDLL
ncbi:hypothetical protein FDH96_gp046 [Mycobacterium phage Rey]|uniref:Uncharacterized protein n=1 Tax=Mycobacterium phage Rey TaxID=1034115 RepID=G1D5A8_9CAUD|nr:hypothetical protein FDH96_gp046 [Mycobacterium phage Rey]AEK09958.1 hypothetical protein PBI_REY_46 [Mycobacterium phage Rey]